MMNTLKSFIAFVAISAFASVVTAAPVAFETRGLGSFLACNVARAKAVAGLAETSKALKGVPTTSDPTIATAVSSANDGLQSAGAGIKIIAAALLTGKNAPAGERDQVLTSLTQAQTALQGISVSDAATSKAVSSTLSKLQKTIDAGHDVVNQCGGGGGSATAASNSTNSTTDTQALSARQIGNAACNAARLQTVTALAESAAAVVAIETAGKGDASTSAAAKTAQAGLTSAGSGIAKIAEALVTFQKAPASARDQVLRGLSDAQTAMGSITSTNKVVTLAVAGAQKLVAGTVTAADAVISQCK